MRIILHCLAFAVPLISSGQTLDSVSLPMKGRLVFYEKFSTSAISKSERYEAALRWVKNQILISQPSETRVSVSEEEISVHGKDKINLPHITERDVLVMPYYEIEFRVTIRLSNDGQQIEIFNFYEKPSYSGVTHDFSKIEYRWRDFAKGKPWYKDDNAFFVGLDRKMRQLISSFLEAFQK